MVALALLFSVVIILLLWLVKLLQSHFDSHDRLSTLKNEISIQTQTHLFAKNAAASTRMVKEQTHRIIADRLVYLNEEISALPSTIETQGEEFELLVLKQQSLLKTYFTLFQKQDEG